MSNQPFPGEGLESTKDGKSNAIQRPLYRDLHTAYSTITSRPGFLQEFQSLHDKNVHSEEHPVVRITPSRVPSGRASSGVLAEDHEYHDGSSDLDHVEVLDHNDTTAGMSNGTLETDIARELRRVSQLSGLSGSVLLVNESHLNDSSAKELGPGSSQSSSSKARSNEVLGLSIPSMNHHYPTSDIPRMWRDTERAGMGIQGHFSKSFRPATVEDDIGDFEDEHDWVTVEENRGGHSFFDNSQAMTKHPADERYDHLYRIRQTTPNGEPMLIPQYTFEGVGFPNRNALTSPILTNPVPSNTYQHPDPLFTDHVHPFKSSPPVIMRSGDEIGTPKTKSHNRSHGIDLARSPGTLDQFDFGFSERSNNSNSFSKVTLLGPKFNVTGTPDGTGMKKAGSSLVASSTPQVPASALVTGRVHYPWDRTEGSDPGWEESVRRHREHLVAEGLLPRTATATPPGGGPGSLFSSRSSFHSLSPSTYLYAFGRPTSYNPTPPLPLNPFFQQASGLDIRLHRLPRSDAHLSPKLRKRKAWLSNAFLLLCAGFPPTWLLYGYGHLDGIMLSISRGEFEQFGKPQKLVGVVLGWASGIALIVGLIVVLVLSLG
ncbi:MAG: hypothetical protein M1816_005689 [Peltula sp. TS41687]|nr:MAG: hypothetical protein M1816_005689 [Peltula sp. TS41687]